jgi:hypothetical protein
MAPVSQALDFLRFSFPFLVRMIPDYHLTSSRLYYIRNWLDGTARLDILSRIQRYLLRHRLQYLYDVSLRPYLLDGEGLRIAAVVGIDYTRKILPQATEHVS